MVNVELVYIPEQGNILHLHLKLHDGATVSDLIAQSQLYDLYPETKSYSLGVYAKPVSLDVILKEGDRVEVYRPLRRDPKEKRRDVARGKLKKALSR